MEQSVGNSFDVLKRGLNVYLYGLKNNKNQMRIEHDRKIILQPSIEIEDLINDDSKNYRCTYHPKYGSFSTMNYGNGINVKSIDNVSYQNRKINRKHMCEIVWFYHQHHRYEDNRNDK